MSETYPKNAATDESLLKETDYRPSIEIQNVTKAAYDDLDYMVDKRVQNYPEFNDRSLLSFLDDGHKRLNAYVVPRDAYDPPKEDWQSNVILPTIKDKQMKIMAGFALNTPEMDMRVFGDDKTPDIARAEIAKNLVTGSYQQETNPILDAFWEAWSMASSGTVIVYEGYLKTKLPQKFIKEYNLETGKIVTEEKEITVDNKCISYIMPLTELYVWDFYTHDVQDQYKLAWARVVNKDKAQMEFGKNPNWKYVKTHAELGENADADTFYYRSRWSKLAGKHSYSIIRLYCKMTDTYIVLVNGVLMINTGLLWKINGKKVYPFGKSGWLPFANKDFFYMQSFPDHMMGMFDQYNTLWNTMTDNQYRKAIRAILVGRTNTDSFNLEDEYIAGSTKITVEDVNQVKEMSVTGIDNADVTMLKLVAQSMDEAAPSLPGLIGNKQATAREVVIANDRLQELKSIYAEMISDLWRQKYSLRLANIQQNYPQPELVYDEKTGKTKNVPRTYIIENCTIDKVKGEIGTLSITFQDLSPKKQARAAQDIAVEEEAMKKQGLNYKKMIVPTDYLDNKQVNIVVQSASVFKQQMGYKQSLILDEMEGMAKFFPQYFVASQSDWFAKFAASYNDSPEKYEAAVQQFQKNAATAQQKTQGGGGMPMPPPDAAAAGGMAMNPAEPPPAPPQQG